MVESVVIIRSIAAADDFADRKMNPKDEKRVKVKVEVDLAEDPEVETKMKNWKMKGAAVDSRWRY